MGKKAKYQTSSFVFTGNPIILVGEDLASDLMQGAKVRIDYEGREVYNGRFMPPLDMDISEILESVSPYYNEPSADSNAPCELIENITPWDIYSRRKVNVTVDYGHTSESFEMIALPGGIPSQQFAVYCEAGKDVFESRLYGPACNFFMTSRTNGWRIMMKETELYPLFFLATSGGGNSMRLMAVDVASGEDIRFEVQTGINVLDPDKLRRDFFAKHDLLPSVFDIYKEEPDEQMRYACQIVITHSDPAKERYRLKIRNSFGVFEIMEVTGKLNDGFEFGEDEEFQRLDDVTRRFEKLHERIESRRTLEIETKVEPGYRNLLRELQASDETYLLDAFRVPVRVNVTVGESLFQSRQETPEKVTLKMELTGADSNIGDFIRGIDDSKKPRVHTKEFRKQFN